MSELFPVQYSWLIPLLPLIGAACAGFLGAKWLKQRSHWPIWIGVGASAALSIWLLVAMFGLWREHATSLAKNVPWFDWITVGKFSAQAGAFIDPLTAVMLCVVTGVGFLIMVYSKGYMHGEAGYFRFFAFLGLFIFMMTVLVMGNNLVMLYLGWEGVGLCSYLLIGYYYERPSAREAAKKAFLVNRVGDFGFGLGIMLCYKAFGTVTYFGGTSAHTGLLELAQHASGYQGWAMQWIPFLLMLGAFGKSAQFPLYVWLPDAMEGPTPVSALNHAATMVTAGVYMIVRCGTLFVGNQTAMLTVAAIGTFTAIFAATIALRQFDLKRILAYSTISQLGFMFAAVGSFGPVPGIFHLGTHAFFKALLFLSAGVVMHATAGELDMRKFSGLKRILPKTRWLMLIGCCALAGLPPFSGFFSKDEAIAAAWGRSPILGLVLLLTAFLTAYYTFRLYFRTFEGPQVLPSAPAPAHAAEHEAVKEEHHHNQEPAVMIWPLVILAVGALFAGWMNFPERIAESGLGGFLGQSPSLKYSYDRTVLTSPGFVNPATFGQHDEAADLRITDRTPLDQIERRHQTMMWASFLIALVGVYVAWLLHLKYRDSAEELAAKFGPLTRLLQAKYWVDEVYQAGIVEPLRAIGRFFFALDRFIIDGLIWAVSFAPQAGGFVLKLTTQRGYLQGYALTMLLGIVIILAIVFL